MHADKKLASTGIVEIREMENGVVHSLKGLILSKFILESVFDSKFV